MADSGFKHLALDEQGRVSVVRFKQNRLVDDMLIRDVGKELFSLIESGRSHLLIDLKGVEYVSSGMLGKLITVLRRIEDSKGRLGICSIGADVQDVFRISKLDTYFKIFDDSSTAVLALSAD